MTATPAPATPGAKMNYLIRRRPTATRDELVANWFALHMPNVIAGQQERAARGELHAWRYIATLFDPMADGSQPWDGVAQLWWDQALPQPAAPHGTEPADMFQHKAEPYSPWATVEHVVLDGALPVTPNSIGAPLPTTRTGMVKLVALVAAKDGVDVAAMHRTWLEVHAPNVVTTLRAVGARRYVVNLSIDPAAAPFAGMAELWFDDLEGLRRFEREVAPDPFGDLVDPARSLRFRARTEMIGIP